MPPMTDSHQKPVSKASGTNMLANILAIIGSVILVIIVIWGLIHLLSISGGFFSSLFKNSNTIAVTAPKEVTSGESFAISWKHKTSENGMYAIMYPCTEGLRFATPGPDNALITMPCGAAFGVGQATTSARITPMLVGTTSIKTPLSVLFIPSSTSSTPIEGTATITVNAKGSAMPQPIVTPATTTPAEQKPETPKPTTPVVSGPGDLAVTITSVNVDQYGNGTVTFNISNIGSGASGSYYFTAQLPTSQPYTYTSPTQMSLSPGSYIVNTLRFSAAVPGSIFVNVDPANTAREGNESNNTATQYISGTYPSNYNYPNYQQNYQYGQQYYNQYNYQPYYDIYNYPYVY